MINNRDETLAYQVVNTVKDVSGQDINFIDESGIIFASTNPQRVGSFHEIGYRAAQTGNTIEVETDDSFHGTQKGINLPVYHNHNFFAVIGITGEPDRVRKYAHLAERVTKLLIRERELNTISRSQADKKHFVIDSLIRNVTINIDYLNECLQEFGIDPKSPKRLILIKVEASSGNANLSLLEQKITDMFDMLSVTLYTFYYPNEYLAVIDSDTFDRKNHILNRFARMNHSIFDVVVGKSCSIYRLSDSHASALIAMKHLTADSESFLLFDDLTLEIIFSGLGKWERNEFLAKTISPLNEEELALLRVYFDENMSLQSSGKRLFLHKNTIQYKLNHIFQKCGLNPRSFKDAVLLYLALKLD